ncbi:MAG: phosphate ABC transporter permease subunit PstC [Thermoplasmata archaeon]|nr:phosphate ABC transporter permease subunit PstC [Thermoplasmata archaeon]
MPAGPPPHSPVPQLEATPRRERIGRWFNSIFRLLVTVLGFGILALAALFIIVLAQGAWPSLLKFGPNFLSTSTWDPVHSIFGVVPFVIGTLLTSAIALLIAVPVSLGVAIFLTEQSPTWLSGPLGLVVQLLAAVPSVVYGFWGFIVLVPYMRLSVEPGLQGSVGKVPGLGGVFGGTPVGTDILTSSVILAIMIIPTISSVCRDSLLAVPRHQREAALSLGATKWETTNFAVLRYASSGIIGAIILGLGRALGETMAVTMTIGNADVIPKSLFSQGQTIASLIANEFTSAGPGSIYQGAIIEAALVLFAITILVNVIARLLVGRVLRVEGGS